MATVTALGVCSEVASVMPTSQRLRQLELVERWRQRNFLPVLCDSRYPTNLSCNAVPAVGRWRNVVIQPIAPVRLGQLVHPDPRQSAMSSWSLVPHRFRVPLMPLRLACNLMSFLPSQNVARYCFARINTPLMTNNPAMHLAHLPQVVYQVLLWSPDEARLDHVPVGLLPSSFEV